VVVAPGRNFFGDCFLEVTSHSIFWVEPGRNRDSWRSVRGDLEVKFLEEKAGLERLTIAGSQMVESSRLEPATFVCLQ